MQYIKNHIKLIGILIFTMMSTIVNAQDNIQINKAEIETWFEQNWIFVAGGLVLLVLLIALVGRSNRGRRGSRRTTTVIKDEQGKTKSVVTTEEPVRLS